MFSGPKNCGSDWSWLSALRESDWVQSRHLIAENATRERPEPSIEQELCNTDSGNHWEKRIA